MHGCTALSPPVYKVHRAIKSTCNNSVTYFSGKSLVLASCFMDIMDENIGAVIGVTKTKLYLCK